MRAWSWPMFLREAQLWIAPTLAASLGFRWRRRWLLRGRHRRRPALGLLLLLLGALDRLGHVLHPLVVQPHVDVLHVLVLIEVAPGRVEPEQRVGQPRERIVVEV